MTTDTGISMNIFDEGAFNKVTQAQPIELLHSSALLLAYGSKCQLEIRGKFTAMMEAGGNCTSTTIHVRKGMHGSLLNYHTSTELDLIDIKVNRVTEGDQLETSKTMN